MKGGAEADGDQRAAKDVHEVSRDEAGVAVLPVEWWDAKWIRDNIQPKLDGMSGNAIAESQQPRRAAQKKRRR